MDNACTRFARLRVALLAGPLLVAIALMVPAAADAATADLAISKSDSPDPVQEGAVLTYTIKVTNLGPGTANGVTVTDDLDSHVQFVGTTASQGVCSEKGKKVTCDVGTLAPDPYNPAATLTIQVKPTKAGTVTNSATVSVGM